MGHYYWGKAHCHSHIRMCPNSQINFRMFFDNRNFRQSFFRSLFIKILKIHQIPNKIALIPFSVIFISLYMMADYNTFTLAFFFLTFQVLPPIILILFRLNTIAIPLFCLIILFQQRHSIISIIFFIQCVILFIVLNIFLFLNIFFVSFITIFLFLFLWLVFVFHF